jgi:DNA replication and repair protein RecF
VQLVRFYARNFRNLEEPDVQLSAGMNVVYGENAQGKTNFLEAVYVLSTLRSFRTSHPEEMVRFGSESSMLQGSIDSELAAHRLAVSLEGKNRRMAVDGRKTASVQYVGVLDVFLFSYPLLEVIRGGPDERRRFLDRSISISEPAYLPLLVRYHSAIRQKVAMLQRLQRGEVTRREGCGAIAAFNQQLLEGGLLIAGKRVQYLDSLLELLRRRQDLFFDSQAVLGLQLDSSFLGTMDSVRKKMEESLEREIVRGACLVGVHRDEVRMTVKGRELRKFGSSGQHRAFLLLLVLAQLELYELWRKRRPVLLLDDLDSELDQKRIRSFLDAIRDRYQTLISSSRPELFSPADQARSFEIRSGKLLER